MMATVLLVEDEEHLRATLAYNLRKAGYDVQTAITGPEAIQQFQTTAPDLVLLDVMLPGFDGFEVCRRIRHSSHVPILMLTARSDEVDTVVGLELGADDYIAKPFSPRELVARVKAVLRRFERPLPPSPMKVGEIEIDPSAMTLTVRGSMVPTTATEFRLLDYFARHKGRVFSRDHLLDSVWRDTAYVTPRSVDVYVRRIREKIEPDPENPRYLKTVRGAGYRFESPK